MMGTKTNKFIVDNLNRLLEKEIFQVELFPTIPTNVKLKITGTKTLRLVGIPTEFLTFNAYVQPTSKTSDSFFQHIKQNILGNEIDFQKDRIYFNWKNLLEKILYSFTNYFDSELRLVCEKIIIFSDPEPMNESLIMEDKYDYVVRTLVRDFISLMKKHREGEFILPEEIYPEKPLYEFPQLVNPMHVYVEMFLSDTVDGYELDGGYSDEDDYLYITITTNRNFQDRLYYNLIADLNELFRHELEHIKQYESGVYIPRVPPKSPIKYYTQDHEVDAQRAGFRRKQRVTGLDFETIVRDWFEKNQNKHNLTPRQKELVIKKILEDR